MLGLSTFSGFIMAISINLPNDIEAGLRARFDDLDAAAKEALLVELYRQNRITHYEISRALALSRFQTDDLLKRHNVNENITLKHVRRDAEISRQVRES